MYSRNIFRYSFAGTVLYYPGCITILLLCCALAETALIARTYYSVLQERLLKDIENIFSYIFSSQDGPIILDILLSILQEEIAIKS
jgi:hypothetical protein